MTQQTFRTIVTEASKVQTARSICSTLAPSGGSAMLLTGLSPTGLPPATHYVSTGHLDLDFAMLMPFYQYQQDSEGAYQRQTISSGSAGIVAALCQQEGFEVPELEVQEVFDASDVTAEDPFTAFARLGLMLVQDEE